MLFRAASVHRLTPYLREMAYKVSPRTTMYSARQPIGGGGVTVTGGGAGGVLENWRAQVGPAGMLLQGTLGIVNT